MAAPIAAIIVPAAVTVAIELIRLARELIASHQAGGGKITEAEREQLWIEHGQVTSAIVASNAVPAPPT